MLNDALELNNFWKMHIYDYEIWYEPLLVLFLSWPFYQSVKVYVCLSKNNFSQVKNSYQHLF